MTAAEVESVILQIAPLAGELPGDGNGLVYGDPATEVTGVAVTWTPTVDVLARAAGEGLNFLLTHETPFFPGGSHAWFEVTPEEEKPANLARRAILDRAGMVVCKCHSNWDGVRTEGVVDSAARALGLFVEIHSSRFMRVYEIGEKTLAELAAEVRSKLGLPTVRVAGDLAMSVSRVGLAIGGLAQNWNYLDELLANGAQAVIVGEAIDYSVRIAVDSGVGFIETSHVGSENPGMRNFARLLARALDDQVPVRFLDAGHPWVYL
ncbi:MAG: Nif3-like dinuclear metal center hexameric protein [Armatimonadetes bacterium]|nr:Nif3-like dinuclear metal center hexameric protein [Armatimonadota bacterium]